MGKQRLVILAIILGFLARAYAQVPPPNDNFADRTLLAGSFLTATGTLVGATFESIETNATAPFIGGPQTGGSVWWTWTAVQSSAVVIELVRDYSLPMPGYTEFDVYSGTDLNGLTLEGENSFEKPSARYVAFTASAGVSYQFRMAGPLNQPFSLKLTATNAPVFLVQPKDDIVPAFGTGFFYARAAEFPGTSYQWKFNGMTIAHQTAPSLVVYYATTNVAGSYSVAVSNATGITESAPATLAVTDTNPVPRLTAAPPTNAARVSFWVSGALNRGYLVESSTNLLTWGNRMLFGLTNSTQLVSVPRLGPTHFVRVSLLTHYDACIAQLKQMRWSLDIWSSEMRLSRSAFYTLQDLRRYAPLNEAGALMPCPAGGTYSATATVTNAPTCNIAGHALDDYWSIGF